jgi:hypothetical protein
VPCRSGGRHLLGACLRWSPDHSCLGQAWRVASDLLDADVSRPPAPTFAEYIPNVSAAVSDGMRRVYGSYARAASPTRNTRPTQKRPASCAANVNPPATTGLWTACRCGLHTETACRRGGTLALRPADLDRTSA